MPLPLAPLAPVVARVALRYGAVALVAYVATQVREPARRDQRAEDAMDEADEGIRLRREPDQMNGTARMRRTIRIGTHGPGVEIDATALGRLRLRRV
ncbi:hypothetical protein [Rhodovulum adriaticum]|uniref:Uncharacterized protein n=1 Tax=Rhodovulum adriaticum TaxID=35804 RepID=A0A4R2P1D6_RHOAD|nr:hypothetical protein [Rhodovulum adriaticum]MBK1635322.1 hypothetical protein [Rhodovulum adriaticum]TCP27744.1 hypothetical protein EV656_101655 [Rhodovulum adriaticum]